MPSKHRLRALALGANLGVLSRRFEESFQYLKKSLEFEPEVNEPELTTYVYSMAADIFRSIGDIERAIDYGHHAVNVAADHAQTRAECVARMRLSAAYRAGDYLPEALEHYRAALEQCRTADDPVYYAIVEFGLGDTLRRKGHLPKPNRTWTRPWNGTGKMASAPGKPKRNLPWHGSICRQTALRPPGRFSLA